MTYPGGKEGAGVYQTIINLMPAHARYFEPFLGGGAILRHKLPAGENVGIDVDPQVLANFSADIAETTETDPPPPFLPGGAGPARQKSRAGPRSGRNLISSDPRGFIARPGEPRRQLELFCTDALPFLQNHTFGPSDLIYCDPPYLHSTRASAKIYRHEMTDLQHWKLLTILQDLPCMVMISGYWSELYAHRLAAWHATSYQAMTRGGTPRQEWLWCNFPRPLKLHDYTYTGANFRQRERIKRKINRWVNRLAKLPETERRAILARIPTPD